MASTIVKYQSTSIQLTTNGENKHKMKKEFVAWYGQSAYFVLVTGLVFGFQLSWDDKKLSCSRPLIVCHYQLLPFQ